MCEYKSRVSSCGHYKVTLWSACDDAKKIKTPCDYSTSSEDASTTGGLCYLDGCDNIPGGKREGPGARSDGGFDPNDVDWDDV